MDISKKQKRRAGPTNLLRGKSSLDRWALQNQLRSASPRIFGSSKFYGQEDRLKTVDAIFGETKVITPENVRKRRRDLKEKIGKARDYRERDELQEKKRFLDNFFGAF